MKIFYGIVFFVLLAGCCLPVNNALGQNYSDTTYVTDSVYDAENTPPPVEENYNEDDETTESGEEIIPFARNVAGDSIRSIKNDKGFYYMPYLDSILRAVKQVEKKEEVVEKPVDNSPSFWSLSIVKYLFWGIAIAVVGFVLFKLFSGDGGMFVTNSSRHVAPIITDTEVPENDLEGLMQRAIRNGDYRLALRYRFLKTLGRLGERGILKLGTDKTNFQYATEVRGRPYADTFARLSLQYEYVWFGEFGLQKEQFESIQKEHQQFLKEI